MYKLLAAAMAALSLLVPATALGAGKSPRATFLVTPSTPAVGQEVTFDASQSQCWGSSWSAASCSTFAWADDGDANDPLDAPQWSLGSGRTLRFTFQGSGTKYVWLTVTDSSGRSTQTMTPVNVVASPTPSPTPTATVTATPTATETTVPTPSSTPTPTPTATPTVAPSGCDFNATPANFGAQFSAAHGGQTLCLASGDYGLFSGASKQSPGVTIRAADGATPTMRLNLTSASGITLDGIKITGGRSSICGGAHDITIKNAEVASYMQVGGCGGPSFNNSAITLGPNLNFTYADDPSGANLVYEGRLSIMSEGGNDGTTPTGILVTDSIFQGPTCADGIFSNTGGFTVVRSTFKNLLQGSCGPHVDSVQWYAGANGAHRNVAFTDDYFVNDQTGLADYDSKAVNTVISNTVFDTIPGPGINPCAAICLAGGQNTTINHVTMRNAYIETGPNHSDSSQSGMVLTNSILAQPPGSESGSYTQHHNLCMAGMCAGIGSLSGTPSWVGGPSPSSYGGFLLAPGSLGENAASDASDIGIN